MRILAITHQYPTPADPTFAPYNRQQFGELARFHELRLPSDRYRGHRAVADAAALGQAERGTADDNGIMTWRPASLSARASAPSLRRVLRAQRASYGATGHRGVPPRRSAQRWAHPDGWADDAYRLPTIVCRLSLIGSDVLVLATGLAARACQGSAVRSRTVIAVSRDLAQHVEALGVHPDRIRVVPEGISTAQFSPGDREGGAPIARDTRRTSG